MSYCVLIVDDSPIMRKMVRRSLEMSGLSLGEVHEAGDGLAALQILEERDVDVVFADLNMPVMSGMEMVERMAADQELAAIPIVIVSTERSRPRIDRLAQLGVDAYLEKPFRPESVKAVVERLVGVGARDVH